MNLYAILCLPAILILGLVSSWEDHKFNTISNVWIKYALSYWLFLNLIFIAHAFFLVNSLNLQFLQDKALNLILACILAFLLWRFDVWGGGDGKLFVTYSALVPLSFYSNTGLDLFPSFMLLINTFVPLSIALIIKMSLKTNWQEKKKALKGFLAGDMDKSQLLLYFATYALFQAVMKLIVVGSWDIRLGVVPRIAIMISLFYALGKTSDSLKKALLLFSPLVIVLVWDQIASLDSILFVGYYLAYRIVRSFSKNYFRELGKDFFSRPVAFNELAVNMVPAEQIYRKENGTYIKDELDMEEPPGEPILSQGKLDERDLLRLDEIKKNINSPQLQIFQTMPLALYLFLGVLLTMLIEGSFVNLIL